MLNFRSQILGFQFLVWIKVFMIIFDSEVVKLDYLVWIMS